MYVYLRTHYKLNTFTVSLDKLFDWMHSTQSHIYGFFKPLYIINIFILILKYKDTYKTYQYVSGKLEYNS